MSDTREGQGIPGAVDAGCMDNARDQGAPTVSSAVTACPANPPQQAALAAGASNANGQCTATDGPVIVAPAGPQPTQNQRHWHQIPQMLRQRPQWCFSPLGTKAPHNPKTGKPASVTDPATWASFALACAAATYTGGQIGYVLSATDPFVCIDLDVKDDTPPEWLARFRQIVEMFASYSEVSAGGAGVHVWCFGNLPDNKGARRDGVEMYCDSRYMVTTGRAFGGYAVEQRQELLDLLYGEMRASQASTGHSAWELPLVEKPPTKTDEAVWAALCRHQKHARIAALCDGRWKELKFPSASEADFALLAYMANSSQSNEQVRRMFRQTILATHDRKNDKHLRGNRDIDLCLRRIRANQGSFDSSSLVIPENLRPKP